TNVGGDVNTLTNSNAALAVSGGAVVQNGLSVSGGTKTDTLRVTNGLSVDNGANVDLGGNVVHGVATPVVGTDAANKAYVDAGLSAANQRIDKANQGIAIAMSVQNPVLTGGDRFGVAVNWGDFAGNNAVGAAAVGILHPNLFGGGEKFGLTGGFGVSN